MQLLGPLVTTRQVGYLDLDLEGGNRICMVLEWTLGLKRLAYSRIDLSPCCSVSLHLMPSLIPVRHGAEIGRRCTSCRSPGGTVSDSKLCAFFG